MFRFVWKSLFVISLSLILFRFACAADNGRFLHKHETILKLDAASLVEQARLKAAKSDLNKLFVSSEEQQLREVEGWPAGAVTVGWTSLELDMFVKHKSTPSRAARSLALTHVAMHDALLVSQLSDTSDINTTSANVRRIRISQDAAVASAAASVMGYVFPSEQDYFERIARGLCHSYIERKIAQPEEVAAGYELGHAIGDIVITYGQADGAARGWNGENLTWHGEGRPYGPGYWEPTPPYNYYPPDEPYGPYWKTWILERADQLRPTPPSFGSPRHTQALQEVKDISEHLTDEQKRIAEYWVDGSGTVTPAGHWNRIALDYLGRYNFDDLTTATLFAYLNMAMLDAQISAWDAKYAYWTVRPVTAIRRLYNVNFNSYILTPPFPSYFSGHAAFSGAGSEVLAHAFWKDAKHLRAMGDEVGMSRLYGGIHYRFDNDDGLMVGRKIAQLAIEKMDAH